MYTYFKTGTPTCRSTCAQAASVRFQHAYKQLGYIKHAIATVDVCAANTFLTLTTTYLFSDKDIVAITIRFTLKFQPNHLSWGFP